MGSGRRLRVCWKETLSFSNFFPTTPNLSTASQDILSPNALSSVTCCRRKAKFGSRLSGSPTNSRLWKRLVASYLGVKSNTSTYCSLELSIGFGRIFLENHCLQCGNIKSDNYQQHQSLQIADMFWAFCFVWIWIADTGMDFNCKIQ